MKANILAAKTVARTLRSSLGPKGMDKMLQSPDGDVTISESAALPSVTKQLLTKIRRLTPHT